MRMMLACLPCALLAAACGDDPQTGAAAPVDAVYRARVQGIENSCDEDAIPDDATALLDVMARSDGTLNVSHRSTWIPGPALYRGVSRQDGRIDLALSIADELEVQYAQTASGTITAESVDLIVTSENRRWNGDTSERCVRKVRVTGTPRPFADPEALDGKYVLTANPFGYACPGDPPREESPARNLTLDADEYHHDRFVFFLGGLRFGPEIAHGGGAVDWKGSLFIDAGFFPIELEGTMKGEFTASAADFALEYGLYGDPSGCTFLERYRGAKRIPSVDAIDNDYRAEYRGRDDCRGLDIDFEGTIQLIGQPDGSIVLDEFGYTTDFAAADGVLSYDYGSEEMGEVLTIRGNAEPPSLSYAVDYKALLEDGSWCAITYQVSAQARYVFP